MNVESADEIFSKMMLAESDEEKIEILDKWVKLTEEERQKLIVKGSNFMEEMGGNLKDILGSGIMGQAEDLENLRDNQLKMIFDGIKKNNAILCAIAVNNGITVDPSLEVE